jgi:alkanesulfonate monooxygenase SsuD/methylene tetrahydromethanopterin reductase-like flavin-dependent oxidoreductase (luciferase family)
MDHEEEQKVNMPRFGIFLPQVIPIRQIIEQCKFVEALGYDSVWIGDQFYNPLRLHDPMWEAWTLLAALATQTNRIHLGTLVTVFIYRNPALVASQALTVDHISGGRLELGLGAGFSPEDHRMTGSEAWEPRERLGRFREGVKIIDLMLRNESTTFEGEYYRVKDAMLSPRPIQKPRPPLTLGVSGPSAMKFAAAIADGWNTPDISPAEYSARETLFAKEALEACRKRQEAFDGYCVAAGRDPHDIRRSLLVGYTAGSPTDSLEAFHEYVGRYREIGINEFIFFWIPEEVRDAFANRISGFDRSMVERVASEAIPVWRK